jgi:hypothetical protein
VCGGSAFAWSNDTSRTAADPALQALHSTLDIPEAGTQSRGWLRGPPNLVELSDGRIVGADLDAGELPVFDSTGARVATWGRRGGGPGEFRDLAAIGAAGGDSTWAYDAGARRLTIFGPAGRIARSAALDFPGAGGFALVLGRLGDGRFVVADGVMPDPGRVRHAPGTVGPDSTLVHLWQSDTDSIQPLGWFRTFDVYVSRNGMLDLTGGAPFGRVATFLATDSGLYYGYPSSLEIQFHSLAGGTRCVLARVAEGGPVSASDVARYKEAALHSSSPDFRPRLEQVFGWLPFPARFPAFGTFAVDGRGRVWVQEYVPRWAAAGRWSLFGPDGRRLGALCAPASFRIAVVREAALLGTMTDDDGLAHAVVVPLPPIGGTR